MTTNLRFAQHAYNLRVHAFVLMSNHFHLLVTSPEANLSEAMRWFIGSTSLHLGHDCRRINQIFARRFKRSLLNSQHYFLNAYKYVYQNPVRAGLCDAVEQYPYSTLRGLLGLGVLDLPLADPALISDVEGVLRWLNERPNAESLHSMRWGLSRKVFQLPKFSQGRINPLDIKLL